MDEPPSGEGSENIEEKVEKIEFKKPVLIGRVGKLPKKPKVVESEQEKEKTLENAAGKSKEVSSGTDHKKALPPAVLLKEISTPIPYKEPKWSGLCPDGTNYAMEVLKSGMILDTIDLTKKSFFVFGRLANCDVVLEHPTISRYHAVIQYKAFAEEDEKPCGWYLQDLGSTHGTFLNKEKLKPSHFVRVRVGHQIKFGTSTRTYVMLGPDFDCEGESELSVTEIKKKALEMKLDRDRLIREAVEQREREKEAEERKREEQGIDWGMGEDAEEEPDLSENPYASTANEELYLTDPKKTLRGYCEREGHELKYDCEERGVGQFICRVELPLDDPHGRPVVAEVIHRGKKKDAVLQCALEACRILDRAGLLRQAKHESKRRKQRDWSADDYYDSDDDNYLDRTGIVEKKRKKRMEQHGGVEEKKEVLTYDDLLKQVQEIEAKIASEEKLLERLRSSHAPVPRVDGDDDALDAFMSSLGQQGQSMAQKAEISKTKMSIAQLKASLSRTQRLAEVARPAHLPPRVAPEPRIAVRVNNVVIGKRIKLKEDKEKKPKIRTETKQDEGEFVEEVDSDDESIESTQDMKGHDTEIEGHDTQSKGHDTQSKDDGTRPKVYETQSKAHDSEMKEHDTQTKLHNTEKDNTRSKVHDTQSKGHNTQSTSEQNTISPRPKTSAEKKMYGPMRPPENYVIPENYFDQESDRDLPEIEEPQ